MKPHHHNNIPVVRPSGKKLNRERLKITDITNQLDLRDSYRTFYPNER